jgi:hypothetical protein
MPTNFSLMWASFSGHDTKVLSSFPKRKMTRTGAAFLQELTDECDVVINAFAD